MELIMKKRASNDIVKILGQQLHMLTPDQGRQHLAAPAVRTEIREKTPGQCKLCHCFATNT